ncbi:hypothetical protein LSH36_141g07030 [Paralvinella palmiformis]|uniref:Uncharacterized protein n=1 Tax=Paralvinella palmiformis TaxID=53620 RepID=A0AAD9JWD7_9ANNE|nr:hypothetical protein LSH36_141g07030 [Paralvinella palmiformis]
MLTLDGAGSKTDPMQSIRNAELLIKGDVIVGINVDGDCVPKAAQNEPAPLGAILTKGAVRDNLPPVARALALHEFKMASHVKMRNDFEINRTASAMQDVQKYTQDKERFSQCPNRVPSTYMFI